MFEFLLYILLTSHIVTSQMIIMPPEDQSACVGGTVAFTCVVMWPDGSTPRGASWFTDGGIGDAGVEPGHTTTNDINGRSAPIDVTNTLTITNVNITDNNGSDYQCGLGASDLSDPVFLTVVADPPTISPTITVQPMSNMSFKVDWVSSSSVYNYQVYWTNLKTDVNGSSDILSPSTSTLNVSLNGVDNYDVRVATVNVCGMNFSETVTVFRPPGKPMNVRFSDNDTTGASFVVQWDEVMDEYFDVTYNVTWNGEDGVQRSNITTGVRESDTTLSYTVTELNNTTTYNVTITAITSCCGAGPVSDVATVMTNMRNATPPPPPIVTPSPTPTTDSSSGSDSTGAVIGAVVGGIVAVIVIIVIIIVVYIFVIRPKDDNNGDKKALRMTSPSGTGTGGRATVTPSSNVQSGPTEVYADIHKPVPHQTAATGEEYAVSNKKPKPQGPTEEYAQIDKSKKSGQQGIQYADLAALPQSTNDPSAKGPTSMYAQVA